MELRRPPSALHGTGVEQHVGERSHVCPVPAVAVDHDVADAALEVVQLQQDRVGGRCWKHSQQTRVGTGASDTR